MRTFRYKLQRHVRTRHIASDVRTLAEVYNHFVALSRRHYRIYGKCKGYKRASYTRMSRHLTKLKKLPKYAHWNTPYSWALQEALRRLEYGYNRFFKKLAKRPPQFRKYRTYTSQTFSGSQCPVRVLEKQDGCPIAKVRINGRWYRFWYSREIQGTVKRVAVKKDVVGDWYVTFTTDDEGLDPAPKTGRAAGFDFGLKDFLTCSDGTKYQSPQFYKQTISALKKAHRNVSRKVKGSNQRRKALKHLARHYRKISNQRADHHWKLALELVRKFDVCFFEDLCIDGMKRLWGRKVSDLSFAEFMLKMQWQATKRGKQIQKIDRFEPTTPICNKCQQRTDIDLKVRKWTCHQCKSQHDRDVNAAMNIAQVGASTYSGGDVTLAIASCL